MFLVYRADDECFYVGLGNNGNNKKKRGGAPADFKPFQCCPTKLEQSTRVPKMTAAKIGESAGSRKAGGNFKFANVPSKASTPATTKDKGAAATKPKDMKKADSVPVKASPLKKGSKASVEDVKPEKKKAAVATKQALAKPAKGKAEKGLFSIDLNWW